MKTKLLLFFVLFLCTTLLNAQNADVWDFGGTQVSATTNNNLLNETVINSWYPNTTAPGSTAISFPTSFTAGALSWVGNSGDRLRTTNTNLTRFDNNLASVTNYVGRVYCNGTPNFSKKGQLSKLIYSPHTLW